MTRPFVLVSTLSLMACTQTPLAPTPPTHVRVLTRWVLSGQSNAVRLQPFLAPFAQDLQTAARDSTPISAWAPGGPLWLTLEPELRGAVRVFIWWQGESDSLAGMPPAEYATHLDDLIARVRAASASPNLPIVLCGVNNYPAFASYRTMQQLYAANHAGVWFVQSDDLPIDLSHLTPDGYVTMAARIAATVEALR